MTKSWYQHSKISPVIERTSREGFIFHSKTELQRWEYLKILEKAGVIFDLERQVKHVLKRDGADPFTIMAGEKPAVYTPDFLYYRRCEKSVVAVKVIEDLKGYRDEASKFRIRVFEALYGQKVSIVQKINKRWVTL